MARLKKNDLHNFSFRMVGYGHYEVTYTTNNRKDYWKRVINNMPLIDATKNASEAKACNINDLRKLVCGGTHYNQYGEIIY